MNSPLYNNTTTRSIMEEDDTTLTTFNLGLPGEDSNRDGILSKLYGKVKLAVSSSNSGDSIDSTTYEDFNAKHNGKEDSWLHYPVDSQGNLSDTSEVSLVAANNSSNGLFTLTASGSLDSITTLQSPQSLTNYSPTTVDSNFIRTTSKAPPTASVIITIATATKQNSANASSNCSLSETSSSSNNSRHHPLASFDNDTHTFSEKNKTTVSFNGMTTLGSSLSIPMAKSKSADSDTQSIATNFSISNTNSLGKILSRLRGQKSNKEYWMPDEQCKECYKCRRQFTVFRRKHHCRLCGQIFCSKCVSHIIPGNANIQKGQVRICNFCHSEQNLDNIEETSSLSTTPNSRLLPSPPSNYDLSDIDDYDDDEDTCKPVIPCQNPPLVAPMMQIPTTAVKKSSTTQYGDTNSTTVALELSDHTALMEDSRNHPISHRLSFTPSPDSSPHGDSFLAVDGLESGGLKRLLDAGASIINSRSRSSFSASTSTDVPQRGMNGGTCGRYMDHGGGTTVDENELSPFLCGNDTDEQENNVTDDSSSKIRDKRYRSVSCLTQSRPYPLQHSGILRHGRSTSTSIGKLAMDQVPGGDNESYDGHRWAKRASRGTLVPLSRQNTTPSTGRKDRLGHLQVNTTGLMKHDPYPISNWSPNHGSRTHSDEFFGLYSPLSPLPTSTSMASSPTLCDSAVDQHGIKSKLLKTRNRRISVPSTNTDLSYSALGHAQNLLRQLMDETSLRDLSEADKSHWETVVMNLLLKLTDHVQPDVRAGDDMDLRHYIKIKKIPGGVPSDSFYVKGVMCSKNVAHKRMAKNQTEPRILILLFALDYSRVEMENQLLSIKPVISQEHEHINNLVGRIIALKPTLLLVKSTVSRLALELLLEANIAVVHNVKYSVIEAVARCTQASVVTSVDKLHGDLFFGHCGSFEIRTFLHEWISHRRKTLLVFGDCAPELGGTIVLRGGTEETLETIKMVMDFMVYVVNNLKLETSFLRDSFAKNRGLDKSQIVATDVTMESDKKQTLGGLDKKKGQSGHGSLHVFLKVYRDTILSTSQYVVFPPPYLLTRLKETEDQLNALDKESSICVTHRNSQHTPTTMSPTCCAVGLHSCDNSLRGDVMLSLPPAVFYTSSDITGSRYELLEAQRHQLNCAWDAYLRESPDYVSPFYHQSIVVLYSNVCTKTTMPCYGPEIRVFEYYRHPSDITLGQYLLDLFADALKPCASAMCDYPVMNHYLSYAHGDARINVMTQQFECPIPGMSDKLLTWSYCKICKKATQVTRVSESTWNYSFGKFLELFLYQQGVYCRADLCPHEMGRHHVRFFGYMNLSVGFQYESIDLLEVAVPSTRLFILSQVQIDLKDAELKLLRTKVIQFYDSITERNKAFPYDLVEPQNLDECKADLEDLSDRATGSKKKVLQILQNIYATTAKNDTLTINWVRRILYQEATEWDMEYTDLVRYYLLPERELLKITTSQLRKMFPADSTTPQLPSGNDSLYYSCVDLTLLGTALDEESRNLMTDDSLKLVDDSLLILPQLSDSPCTSPGFTFEMKRTGNHRPESNSLSQHSIRRRLSLELNRELQLRFRVTDSKEEQPQPPSYYHSQTRTPGATAAALTPSRIPMPSINITSTSRSLLSPPIYDTLGSSPINPRLNFPSGGNRIPMAPLKVPSSLELNVATPGIHLMSNKDILSRRNDTRIFGPSELRLCLPAAPGATPQPTIDSAPTFMQQKQRQPYRSGLHTQSLQHVPSMFKSQYANNESGRRALGGIRRRTTAPSNSGVTISNAFVKPGNRHHGPFKSRLPRRKTHIQVYTQANDLVKEDMDDEFLINDLDDTTNDNVTNSNDTGYEHAIGGIDLDNTNYSKSISGNIRSDSIKRYNSEGNGKQPTSSTGKRTPLQLSMPKPVMDLEKMAEINDRQSKIQDGPIDYFSPQAPYTGTSGVAPTPSADQDRINQSVAAAIASVPRTPFSIQSMISASASQLSSSMLERINTTPSTDSGTSTYLHENQLPLASDLLSSPAATSTTGSLTSAGRNEATEHQKTAGLPRNALIERPARRTIDLDEVKQVEKTSFVKTITNFLTDTGTGSLLPLNNPLNPVEHIMPDSFAIVREDEPSTIIAYTLSCDDYLKKMKEISGLTTATDTNSLTSDTNIMGSPLDDTSFDSPITAADTDISQAHIQETLLKESGNHMRYNFSDGNTKFFCKTFFTEQFDALRRQCGCDRSYILSLASCVKWDAVGGKSGSAFLKTKDDRFLMKQMSRYELDAFLGFAPAYFQHLSKAFFKELPTVLAKIFGFYSIGYKNSSSGKSMRMDVLVMENLFYQRNVKKIFDLKGSMRNRHVESTGKEDEVLLDENLVELIFQSPLFIRAHSKEILRSSLHNDTLFLSGSNVMDYSLLVGIDEERHELVVGIVDFIRTFTWDKKLESWVKESVFLGPGVKEPTIVSPRLYRLRFRAAMERYFLMVPDVWALAKKNRLPPPSP